LIRSRPETKKNTISNVLVKGEGNYSSIMIVEEEESHAPTQEQQRSAALAYHDDHAGPLMVVMVMRVVLVGGVGHGRIERSTLGDVVLVLSLVLQDGGGAKVAVGGRNHRSVMELLLSNFSMGLALERAILGVVAVPVMVSAEHLVGCTFFGPQS
jgi:hypothetical protein